jgi:hypothetical protein
MIARPTNSGNTPPARRKGCGCAMTSKQQRVQFGRLIRYGLRHDDYEHAKQVMPRCERCVTPWLWRMSG